MAAPTDLLEALAAGPLADSRSPSKRALVIVNPYATTVSDRLKNLVLYALRGRYEVQAAETQARGHATEICREAAHEGYDVVIAFGGDGTVSEAAAGLAGSPTPLTVLPGGATNVYCRMLGIPDDIVDATEHLLRMADLWTPRHVDLGVVNDRSFLFSAGVGLDASVVRRVDAHPRLKARAGEYYFTWVAVATFIRRYLRSAPRIAVDLGQRRLEGVTAVIQNGDPYTYFGRRPVQVTAPVTLTDGCLAGAVLRRANLLDTPGLMRRALSRRGQLASHPQIDGFNGPPRFTIRSLDGVRVPLQVDGDFIGEVDVASFALRRRALRVVS